SARFPKACGEVLGHGLKPRAIVPRRGPQSPSQVVLEHDIPGTEDLCRQKLVEIGIAFFPVDGRANQVADIPVEEEQAGGAREVQVSELPCPSRIPDRQVLGSARW